MVEEVDGYDAELARWLEDSGTRCAASIKHSPEELLQFFEKLTGTKFATREDIVLYVRGVEIRDAERARVETKRRVARESIFVLLLTVAAGQYYYWDVSLQIASLHTAHYFTNTPGSKPVAR